MDWTSDIFWGRHLLNFSVFCLEAGNLKYRNCWNKNFANLKGLKESKADLAFLLKLQGLHLTHLSSLLLSSSN